MAGIYVIGLLIMGASMLVSHQLKSRFRKYSQLRLSSGLSGREVAEKMLVEHGIRDVKVISVDGELTDHYDPIKKTVNLSRSVYDERNAAAAAVAAHEVGHAVQHKMAYSWLMMRSRLVPIVSLSSRVLQWVILGGILLLNVFPQLLLFGILLFAFTTLFAFVTLPVEYDASNRALKWIQKSNVVNATEYDSASDALNWAARTYVVAAIGSLATLLYYISIYAGRRR
jgi:Zn-dependent membrane protease YugP